MNHVRKMVVVPLCALLLAACVPLPIHLLPIAEPTPSSPSTDTMIGIESLLPTPDNTYTYYRLLIYGDGTVIYEGYQGEDWGIVQGRHTTTVDPARIDALLYEFGRLDFFNIEGYPVIGSLPDIDHTDPMDFLFPLDDYPSGFAPARTIGLKIGDKHNAVLPGFAGSEKSDNTYRGLS